MSETQRSQTWLDKAIGYIAPITALRRDMARVARQEFQASHRGGVATRTDRPWPMSTSVAMGSKVDRTQKASMRDRARNAYRNNAIARSLLDTEVDNVIAEGMTLQARTKSNEFNREAEERFGEWLDNADIRGVLSGGQLQRMAYRQPRLDGDGGWVLVDQGGRSRIQLIAGDLIKTPDGKLAQPNIIDGVEVDRFGRPVAFHVLDIDENGKRDFARIVEPNFVYLPHIDEPNQIRGLTCYAAIFSDLDQIDEYKDALIIAARMGAIFGLIFKGANAAQQYGGLPSLTNSQGNSQKAITLENGSIRYQGAADDVVQVQAQQPMQQAPDFIRMCLRLVGMAFDMPLELVLKDVSQANLSSLRGGMQNYYRSCRSKQRSFIKRGLEKTYRWWVSREVKLGNFTSDVPEFYWPHEFQPRGWAFTDPLTEPQAIQLEIDMGINTPQRAAAAMGRDWEQMQGELAAAREKRQAKKLPAVMSTYTRHPQSGVGAQGDPLGYDAVEMPSTAPAADSPPVAGNEGQQP